MNQAPAALIHPQISEKEGTLSGWRWLTLRPPCSCDPSCSVRKQGQEICFKSNFSASSLSCHLANCDGLAFSVFDAAVVQLAVSPRHLSLLTLSLVPCGAISEAVKYWRAIIHI